MHNSKQRFTNTVENYVKYRPHYPEAVIELLKQSYGLSEHSTIADVGAGTGIFSALLLKHDNPVFAVEPNDAMRLAAEKSLAHYACFHSIAGDAENTKLPDKSVDFITCAQAFHWFDRAKTKIEFKRILKAQGWVVLIWNLRQNTTPFMQAYENLLMEFGTDYQSVKAEGIQDKEIEAFFAPNKLHIHTFDNSQKIDWDGLRGRLLSTSYVPKVGEKNYDAMLKKAEEIFHTHQKEKTVDFVYETKMYCSKLAEG